MNKKGYIAVNIKDNEIKRLINWVKKVVQEKDLVYSEINGKKEGGNVIGDAHLTLFFGLKDSIIDKKEIEKILKKLNIKHLEITGVNSFPVKEIKAKILYFSIKDTHKKLEKNNNIFLNLPHYKKDQHTFTPHITIAYVKDTFDEKKMSFNLEKKLLVKNIEYLTLD